VPAATIHIEPRRGAWVVRDDTEHDPVSEHGDCTAATNAARERARGIGDVMVLLHDRYGRVRPLVSSSESSRRFLRAPVS
jgi:uncharacterized protein DUF2188